MEQEKVFDRRKIKLEDILKSDYIPLFDGRPPREERICNDDIVNLEIMLDTINSVDDFIKTI